MARLRTHTKLVILMGVVVIAFFYGLIGLYHSAGKQALLQLEDKTQDRAAILSELVDLYGAQLKTLANDYSLWGEMVDFVRNGDSSWAHTNIDVALDTYHADAVWVFKVDGTIKYRKFRSGIDDSLPDSALEYTLRKAISQRPFNHFFYKTAQRPIEIRTAPIQPSDDDARATTPQGFLVAGRILDSLYLADIERTLQAKISFGEKKPTELLSSTIAAKESRGIFIFEHSLPGLDGQPVAELICRAESPLYLALRSADRTRMIYIGVFCGGIMLILFFSLYQWVSLPLRQVMNKLQLKEQNRKGHLQQSSVEFEKIEALVSDFFEQKRKLESEINEHRQTEKALSASEERFHDIASSLADWIWEVDSKGRYIFASEKVEQVLGYSPAEILEKSPFDLMPPEEAEKIGKIFGAIAAEKAPIVDLENWNLTKDGRKICLLTNGLPILGADGELLGYRGVDKDITERKLAEAQKREIEDRLERAERFESLGLLAGGVAHDLNNMLGPIVGYSELLLRESSFDPKIRDRVRKIAKSAEDAAAVIQDLLTMARRGRYDMHPLNLNRVISSYLESVSFEKLKEQHPNITCQIDLSQNIGSILGSEMHLGKVIMNLVTNAFEAMPQGGVLSIKTEQLPINMLLGGYQNIDDGQYVVVRIKDSGVGIAQQDIERIFEPYFSKKVMGQSGSGLGLSVVYGVVKDHKGYYDVLSEIGGGTEFILYFPISSAPASKAETSKIRTVAGNESVLIVDDTLEQRELAGEIVSSLGYTAYSAENGHRAVDFISKHEIDVIMLDMVMEPDFDGLDTYREILKINPRQRAIVVSGFSATERVQELLELGAGCYVKKPYSINTLSKALRKELDKSSALV
jgi:PAS domain S-box-containing protein